MVNLVPEVTVEDKENEQAEDLDAKPDEQDTQSLGDL